MISEVIIHKHNTNIVCGWIGILNPTNFTDRKPEISAWICFDSQIVAIRITVFEH
jgi:hypothetical protein